MQSEHSICSQCKSTQFPSNLQLLKCSHFICLTCLPTSIYTQQLTITCPQCLTMTLLKTNNKTYQVDPQSYVICLQCKSQPMTTRNFLQGQHRKHEVVPVNNVLNEIQRNLKRYQMSLDLENQVLYSQAQMLIKEKRTITDHFNKNISVIQIAFKQLHQTIQAIQSTVTEQYEKSVLQIINKLDNKIKGIKQSIVKCESYIQCIDFNLIKCQGSKSLNTINFLFKNQNNFQQFVDQLMHNRKIGFQCLASKQVQSKAPNLLPLKEIHSKLKVLTLSPSNTLSQHQQLQQFQPKLNPESQISQYFEIKRREILTKAQSNSQSISSPLQSRISKAQQNSKTSRIDNQKQTNNIQSRIQSLRKTLKL